MRPTSEIKDRKKVLVYLFGSLGDTIVAIPALRAVRDHYADAEIVLLQNVTGSELVKASEVIPHELIDRSINYRSRTKWLSNFSEMFDLWKRIKSENFDSAIYLVISERPHRSVVRDKVFFRLCGIGKLIGFHAFSNDELYPMDEAGRCANTDQESVRKLKRLSRDGFHYDPSEVFRQPLITAPDDEIHSAKAWLAARRRPGKELIAIAPGCKTIANIWPLDNFLEIGRRLLVERNCDIIVTGGRAEKDLADHLIDKWGQGINAAGKFSVMGTAALLSLCDLYIGLDTGTTHLAAAVDARCFCIYGGRNNPGQWYPLGSDNVVIYHRVECAGCRLQACPLPEHPCMNSITVDAVWEHLSGFISTQCPNEPTTAVPV